MPINAPVHYAVGPNPISVSTGDFNMDGILDLAVANYGINTISILLGKALGSFENAVSVTVGRWPTSIAVGDFNIDGKPDLAVANRDDDNITILRGNGNGTFTATGNYPVYSNPFCVVVGDFNGDGKLDLAVANWNQDIIADSRVSILIGKGDSTFEPAVNYPVGVHASSVAVGDFNRDGTPDLAVTNYSDCDVAILLGIGDGTFAAAEPYNVGTNPWSVAAADFNGDGKTDLATANIGSDNVSILLGNGDGTFTVAENYTTGTNPRSVAVGDFNLDGKPDLVTANQGSNDISLLLGDGDGKFNAPVNYAAGTWSLSVAVGDFNMDGAPDLATANFNGNNISILLNTAASASVSFSGAVNYGAGVNPISIADGDLNRDGIQDLAVANYTDNTVSILLGVGNGKFTAAASPGVGLHPRFVAIGDFNRDGKPDLATANETSNDVSILRGNGDGTFAVAASYLAGTGSVSVAVGDFNRDGKPDLATADYYGDTVSILRGNGDGTFTKTASLIVGTNPFSVAAGDFNRDGKIDLVAANDYSDNVTILLGNGNGTFDAAVPYLVGTRPNTVTTGDFNMDGKLDLATDNYDSNDVSVLIGNGDGTFAAAASYAAGTGPSGITVGDFNLDGKPDLTLTNSSGVSVLPGQGNGTFGSKVDFSAGSTSIAIAVGDFNRDGRPDLGIANWGGADISILLNTTPPPTVTTGTGVYSSPSWFYMTGSLTGLGTADTSVTPYIEYWGPSHDTWTLATITSVGPFNTPTTLQSPPGAMTPGTYTFRAKVQGNQSGTWAYGDNITFIFQAEQPHTITTSTNTGTLTVHSNLGNITSLSAISIQILPNWPPLLIFPHGLMYFEVSNIIPGSTVTFTIAFPVALPANIQYWKYQITRGWFQIPITSHNGNVITIQITDGGLGDADGLANGTIVDPGGVAIPATPTPTLPNPLIGTGAPTSHGSSVAGTAITTQPVQLPNIQIQSASLSASKVSPGTPVKVTANVANRGTVNGAIRVKVYVNGEEESSQGVTIESGSNRPVYFTVSRNEPGTYSVYIGGTQAGSFTVEDVIDPNMILFISCSVIAIALMLVVVYVLRRREYG